MAPTPKVKPGEGLGVASLVIPLAATVLIWTWIGTLNLLQAPASMLNFVGALTVLSTGALAATEAGKLGIGADGDISPRGIRRSGPLGWFVFHALLWVFAFPAYFYWRSRYGAKNMIVGGIIVTIVFFGSWVGMGLMIASASERVL